MKKGFSFFSTKILRNRQSIVVRLFTSFVSSSLLIIILTGIVYYVYARQTTINTVHEQVQNSLRKSVALFETGFQSPIESQLKLLESTPSMNNFLTVQKTQATLVRFDIEKQFVQLIRSRPELYRSIRFVDAFGNEAIHVDANKRHRNYESIADFKKEHPAQLTSLFGQLKQQQPQNIIFSQPFKTREGRYLFYAGITKMEPEIGGIGGAIIIECDLSPYIQSLDEVQIYGLSIAWLVSAEGEIIAQPKNTQHELPSDTKADNNKIVRHDLNPGLSISDTPFISVILRTPEIIFDDQNQTILKTIIFIALFAIFFTFLVAWMVSKRITQPLTGLVLASHQLANGDYTTRSHLNDQSEIGELSKSFNHMAETLEQSIQSLDQQLTSRISAEQALHQSHESLELILKSTGEGIFGIDTAGLYTFCNPSALQLLGYKTEQELIGKNMHRLIQHSDADGQPYNHQNSLILTTMHGEKVVHSDNEVFWRADQTKISVEYRAHPVKQDGKIVGAVISFSDISERKQKDKKIAYQAHYDMLTGLPNRFLAMDRLEQMLLSAQRNNTIASVLFIDLDGFKKVNDMLGHEMGDKVLIESALRLKDCLRNQDTVGRLGGDEFIVLLSDLKQQLDVRVIVENILGIFRKPFNIENHELLLTASIGIACYPNDSEIGADLLRNADIAMYESKQSGRNTFHFFSEEVNFGIQRRLEVEEQLHYALAKNEFHLVYQPIMDIQSMTIYGAEVLVRWNNNKLGMIMPDEFIPISEQTGNICELGKFILEESIAQTSKWQKSYNKPLKISINVSPRQLHEKEFLDDINALLKKYDISGNNLQLELTEGVLMSKNTAITKTLAIMRDSQIHIAMDDFGTGYSSLSYLRNYPFNSLKIDRTFIRDIHRNANDKALVMATLNMSHSLSVKVVAEGIEGEEQLHYLQQAGCEYGQGYFFSKPLPPEEFEQQFLQTLQLQ